MKKKMYATVQTTEGELLTLGTAPFSTREECVESLCQISRKEMTGGEDFSDDETNKDIDNEIEEMRKYLAENDVYQVDSGEYAILELWIDEKDFASASEHVEEKN